MKITIDNRDLLYCIDTYAMFTGESSEESEVDYYADEYGLTDDEIQSIGFDYDHKGIVKALAERSVETLKVELLGDVVKSITLTDSCSPQFYNYTSDSYTAEWDIDFDKLAEAVLNHRNEDGEYFQKYLLNSSWGLLDDSDSNRETLAVAMLDFWLPSVLEQESYNMALWEAESEIYSENMTLDNESKKLIESKGAK